MTCTMHMHKPCMHQIIYRLANTMHAQEGSGDTPELCVAIIDSMTPSSQMLLNTADTSARGGHVGKSQKLMDATGGGGGGGPGGGGGGGEGGGKGGCGEASGGEVGGPSTGIGAGGTTACALAIDGIDGGISIPEQIVAPPDGIDGGDGSDGGDGGDGNDTKWLATLKENEDDSKPVVRSANRRFQKRLYSQALSLNCLLRTQVG